MEDERLRLGDRLEDIAFSKISSSLYCAYNKNITAFLEDMEDFFTYMTFICCRSFLRFAFLRYLKPMGVY